MKKTVFILCLYFISSLLHGQDPETDKNMNRIYKNQSFAKAAKNPLTAERVYVDNYRDSIFPNDSILKFKNLISLRVDVSSRQHEEDTAYFRKIRVDTNKLKQLSQLRYLAMSGFDFSTFPIGLCSLTKLKGLALDICQIKELPAEISQLSELSYLQLRINYLTGLPPEFENMTNLQTVDLSNNKLLRVPIELSRLKSLRELDLSNVESNKFIPAGNKVAFEININKIDYLSSYETLRLLLSSEKIRKVGIVVCRNEDLWLFYEKIKKEGLTKNLSIYTNRCD